MKALAGGSVLICLGALFACSYLPQCKGGIHETVIAILLALACIAFATAWRGGRRG